VMFSKVEECCPRARKGDVDQRIVGRQLKNYKIEVWGAQNNIIGGIRRGGLYKKETGVCDIVC